MTLEDRFGLLFMGYFALVISLGVGIFARGATALACLAVVALTGPIAMLLALAIADAATEARRAS